MLKAIGKIARGIGLASALVAALTLGAAPVLAQSTANPIFNLFQQGVWVDLGTGPMTVQIAYGAAVLNVASSCSSLTSAAGGVTLSQGNASAVTTLPFNTTLHVCATIVARVAAQLFVGTLGYFGPGPARFNHWHAYCNCYDNLP